MFILPMATSKVCVSATPGMVIGWDGGVMRWSLAPVMEGLKDGI